MILNYFTNRKFLFLFEINLIDELYKEYAGLSLNIVEISVKNVSQKPAKSSSTDLKFYNYTESAFQMYHFEYIKTKYPQIKFLPKEVLKPDFSIFSIYVQNALLYTKSETVLNFENEENTIKNEIGFINNLFQLKIFKFNLYLKKWESFSEMCLQKDTGVCNLLEKYYFYSTILILKTIRIIKNGAESRNEPVILRKYIAIPKLIYDCFLISKIVLSKIYKKKLNWKIAVKQNNQTMILNPEKNSFWADPFNIKVENKNFIFIEEFNYATNLGEIAVLELDSEFNLEKKTTVLKDNFHFSFPNVFQIENDFYMMPETSTAKQLSIYKSKVFPYQWKKHFTLMENVKLIDAVFLKHKHKYYIFANKIQEFEYTNNECMYIYYADELFTNNWRPHALNPVITNLKVSRNAGAIYKKNARIFRPAQNCEKSYGREVRIQEITDLSPKSYAEITVERFKPPKKFVGLHTYQKIDDATILIDLLKEE